MKYRIIRKEGARPAYHVQMRRCFLWITVKKFPVALWSDDGNDVTFEITWADDPDRTTPAIINGHSVRIRDIGASRLAAIELLEHLDRDY